MVLIVPNDLGKARKKTQAHAPESCHHKKSYIGLCQSYFYSSRIITLIPATQNINKLIPVYFRLTVNTFARQGGGRVVPLRGLKQLRPQERVIPKNRQRRWRALRQAAGFDHRVPDVCRHTFASYHAAYFKNLPELQLEMGHRDCELLRTRYMSPMLINEARHFRQASHC